jgi:4-hydroxybenzoate polyprenyltransferase
MILGHRFADAGAWTAATLTFVCFSLCASCLYLVNDLMDLATDRIHPLKRFRPLAAGEVSPRAVLFASGALLLAACVLSWPLPRAARLVLLMYVAAAALYSAYCKAKLMVDIVMLAGFYTLRIMAGGAATGIEISPWTLAFSMFLFQSIAFIKRFSELQSGGDGSIPRRPYRKQDAGLLSSLGVASGLLSVLVLALYLQSSDVRAQYSRPRLLWFLFPVFIYWISRLWVLANRGQVGEDPILFALKDGSSYVTAVTAVVAGAVFVAAL